MSESKLGGLPQIALTEAILKEIVRYGLDALPSEACGVLIPTPLNHLMGEAGQVVRLPNRAMNHTEAYVIRGDDIRLSLENWSKSTSVELQNMMAIWHTHPGGNIGPSRADMKSRYPGVAYLVVALVDGKGIPAWF